MISWFYLALTSLVLNITWLYFLFSHPCLLSEYSYDKGGRKLNNYSRTFPELSIILFQRLSLLCLFHKILCMLFFFFNWTQNLNRIFPSLLLLREVSTGFYQRLLSLINKIFSCSYISGFFLRCTEFHLFLHFLDCLVFTTLYEPTGPIIFHQLSKYTVISFFFTFGALQPAKHVV